MGRVAQLVLLTASVLEVPHHLEASAARRAKLGDESRNCVSVRKHTIHNVPNLLIHWDARLIRADHP